jgi:hypothetical protein
MTCAACGAENPNDNVYCGKCGAGLDAAVCVDRRVEQILSARFRDRSLIEYEISDRLVQRFTGLWNVVVCVFAPSMCVLAVALAIAGWLGFKTFSDALQTIKNVGTSAASEVQGKAKDAENAIDQATQKAQAKIDADAESPALKQSIRNAEAQARQANERILAVSKVATEASARVTAVIKSADENQVKLTALSAARESNPGITLGQLSSSSVSPSIPGESLSLRDLATVSVVRRWLIGSSGDEVRIIQTRLKERGCYSGGISGNFDQPTSEGVISYKRARSIPGLTPDLYDGIVDIVLFNELESGIMAAKCKP